MKARLWYVNVYVTDFPRAVDFYANTLGLPLAMREDSHGYASFATDGAGFAVARVDPENPEHRALVGRHTGIGLGVADLDASYRELDRKGVKFTMPPQRQPWGGYMAMIADPEGNILVLDQLRAER
jgi:predicted enzyme related to lactoylglutathione lyase